MKTRLCITMAAFLVGAAALPATASACDFHGGGYFGQMSGANWTTYKPRVSFVDPAFESDAPAARAERTKPVFSAVAQRASDKALAARVKSEDASDEPVKKASLKTDR